MDVGGLDPSALKTIIRILCIMNLVSFRISYFLDFIFISMACEFLVF